jgi:hypothetical protein
LKEPGNAGNDEKKVAYAANQHHQRIRLAHMAGFQQSPELAHARLDEMSHEKTKAVPSCSDEGASAKPPRTIPPSEYENGNINQRLEQVQ